MRRTFRSFRQVALGSAAALCLAGGAHAQESGEDGEGATTASDIVVTAQRRSERLIDVPASISVLSSDALGAAGITNTRELAQLTPGLQISNTGAFTSIAIRGVSSETAGPGAENNVAIYLDGVYLPSKSAGVFDFPDVESIEVLKGPQGTLYGRNATGGAILFKTADPTFDPNLRISGGYGSFGDREIKGTASAGIVDGLLAASVAGYYRKTDGYLKSLLPDHDIGGIESRLVRGKLLLTPSSTFRVVLSAYYSDRKDQDTMAFTTVNGNTDGVLFGQNVIVASQYGFNAANNPNIYRNKTLGLSARAEFDTSIGRITSLTGYTDLDASVVTDGDNSSATGLDYITRQPQETFTQDLYLSTDRLGALRFVVGASYIKDEGNFRPVRIFVAGNPILDINSRVKTEAFAAYLEADVDVTDRFNITGGIRWTTEEKRLYAALNSLTLPFIGKKRWNNFTPRVALRYEVSDDVNVYASWSRGFKSGQFNASSAFGSPPVRPEIVDAFEGGVKAKFGSDLFFNLSAFHYDYSDIQVTTFGPTGQFLQNAAKAELYGLDADLTFRPVPGFTLTAGVALLHSEYKSFPSAVILVPIPAANCPAGFAFCGNQNASADLTGNQLARAPKFTGTITANYRIHAGDQTIDLDANVYHSGRFYWESGNRVSEPSYTVVGGKVSWNIDNGPFTAAIWGKNLTDKAYFNSQGIGLDADGLLSAPPRSWGITLSAEF